MPAEDVIVIEGLRLTTGVRTFVDIARFTDGDDAVVGADQCLHVRDDGRSVTTMREVADYLDRHAHLHRSRRVRAVLTEADGGAESPPETHVRLLLHRAGLTMFATQIVIDGGRYRLDLGALEAKVAVEYDGRDHSDPDNRVWMRRVATRCATTSVGRSSSSPRRSWPRAATIYSVRCAPP